MKNMISNYVLGALACIVMGAALIVNPHIIGEVLNTAVGVILIVWAVLGIIRFIAARASDSDGGVGIFSLFGSLIILAAGIFVFVRPNLLETALMLALGFYLISSGLPKIITSLQIKKTGSDKWTVPFVMSLFTVLLGILVVLEPTKIMGKFMWLVGIILLLAGVVNFISGFTASSAYKSIQKDLEYKSGRGRDKRDTHEQDKDNAVDV